LVYLLCVLAPAVSFALPGSKAAAPCLIDAAHMAGMVHVHNDAPAQHVHMEGHLHDHAGAHSHANSADDRAISTAPNGGSVPEKAPHAPDGQCCGLTCVTALPAALIDIARLSPPTALCELEFDRKVSESAPSRRYRPPISWPDYHDAVSRLRGAARTCGPPSVRGNIMRAQFRAILAAVGSVAQGIFGHRFSALAGVAGVALTLGGCLPAAVPLAGADPADPGARVAGAGYRSTVAPYTSLRPTAPSPWREQNDRVAPAPKSDH
jgi:hypothetical protein